MKKSLLAQKNLLILFILLIGGIGVLASCSDNNGDGNPIKKSKISGVSQKGPFVEGSTATLYELNGDFAQTGRSFRDIIADNKGAFEIKNIELISQFAMLEASGFYRNEVTGKVSTAPITLFAIADMQEKDQVNVNILTHLEYYRILNLVENEGKSVKEAKKLAQKEIFAVFGIDNDSFKDSEDMSIFGASESDAALLAISILLQSDLGEGEFSRRLTNFSQAIRSDGVWNDDAAKTAIADWASSANLQGIRSSILGWGLASNVPNFEKYARDYWTANYGLGVCNAESQGNVAKNANANSANKAAYYSCNGSYWELFKSFAPTLSCGMSNSSVFEGVATQPELSCSDGSLPFDDVLKGTLPNWDNLKPGIYAVNVEANCGVEVLKADCGILEVKQVELSCGSVQASGIKGVAITPPTLACNNSQASNSVWGGGNTVTASNIVWENAPNWANPADGTYRNISVTATCGNVTKTANCDGTLAVKVPCSDFNVGAEIECASDFWCE